MQEVSTSGRTVLFVSHQLDAVKALCTRAVLLENGRLTMDGTVEQILDSYLKEGADSEYVCTNNKHKNVQIARARVLRDDSQPQDVIFEIHVESDRHLTCSVDVRLTDPIGRAVGFGTCGTLDSSKGIELQQGINRLRLSLSAERLAVGTYYVSLDVTKPFVEYFDRVEKCLTFSIDHTPNATRSHAFLQSWGYGSVELPVQKIEPVQKIDIA